MEFHGPGCPACGESPFASVKALNKRLQKYSYPLIAGLFGVLAAVHFYPPLDENSPLILALCVFFFPIILHLAIAVRKRVPRSFDSLRRAYLYCGSAVILIAAFLALNGLADPAPARQVQTSITRMYITSGRYSTGYHLVVPSWRPGRDRETLRVDRVTYHNLFIGEPIVFEVHHGLFAVPWYGRVLPE